MSHFGRYLSSKSSSTHGRFVSIRVVVILFCALLSLLSASDVRAPLEDVHWDSPIWLHAAKGYAQTPYLEDMRQCALEFGARQDKQSSTNVPDCYFQYSRLGHVIILGELIKHFDSKVDAVIAATFCYRGMLALGLLLLAWLIVQLHTFLNGVECPEDFVLGIAVSTFLYATSAIFSYLGSSLVSDVPSMLLVICACLLFVGGLSLHSIWRVAFSGVLGFLAYVVRLESVITYIFFLLALGFTLYLYGRKGIWWYGFVIAGAVALIMYGIYYMYVYPLASPMLYLVNAGQVKDLYHGKNYPFGFSFFLRAGGLLWAGFLLYLVLGRRSAFSMFAVVWLVVLMIPLAPWLLQQGPTQTRHYAFIVLPLMALSAAGWSSVLKIPQSGRQRLALIGCLGGAVLLGLLSHAQAYAWARHLPGMWRISQALQLPGIEKVDFPLDQAVALSEVIYKDGEPTVVFISPNVGAQQDYVFLLSYFGPAYNPDTDAIKFRQSGPDRAAAADCAQLLPLPSAESALFYRGELTEECGFKLRSAGVRVLRLASRTRPRVDALQAGELEILAMKDFLLTRLP